MVNLEAQLIEDTVWTPLCSTAHNSNAIFISQWIYYNVFPYEIKNQKDLSRLWSQIFGSDHWLFYFFIFFKYYGPSPADIKYVKLYGNLNSTCCLA